MILHSYLYSGYSQIIEKVQKNLIDKKYGPDLFISDTLAAINFLYGIEDGQRRDRQLFEIYIDSDDYVHDIENLFYNFSGFRYLKHVLLDPKLIVYRRNKVMFRIRAQIENLEYHNLSNLAFDITSFLISKYSENSPLDPKDFKDLNRAYLAMQEFGLYDDIVKEYLRKRRHEYVVPYRSIGLFMDSYLLPRMFRQFYPESNQVFVYAGYAHIAVYIEFFEETLGERVKKVPEKVVLKPVNRCLKVWEN